MEKKRRQHDQRPRPLGAEAIARTGGLEACLAVLENPRVSLTPSAIKSIAARFGHLGVVREALFARPELPPAVRLLLVRQLSGLLAGFVAGRGWLARNRAGQMRREMCEQAAVAIAARHGGACDHPLRHFAADTAGEEVPAAPPASGSSNRP